MLTLLLKFSRIWPLLAAYLMLSAPCAHAHDPFDGTVQASVLAETIEVRVTLGFDASRAFLTGAGVTSSDLVRATQPGPSTEAVRLPLPAATRLLGLSAGGRELYPTTFAATPRRDETDFLLSYPRPQAGSVHLRAAYFGSIEHMRVGMLSVLDARGRLLLGTPLSKDAATAQIPLTSDAAHQSGRAFSAYFKLGVEHILAGWDHLLFLCALLLGMSRATARVKPMVVLITTFTLAHSLTLGLAALNRVALAPAIVEPLIAVSIVVACIDNLLRRDGTRERYAMAALFGLLHGFGFAAALREEFSAETSLSEAGGNIVLPLLSFNLGVEAGQLLVAAMVVPLLLLASRIPGFLRYGLPTLSLGTIVVSLYWLLERIELI